MAKKKAIGAAAYDASALQKLEGLEAVRKRPGMYLGDTQNGGALHKLIDEVVDNSVDEHLAGFCTEIHVTLKPGEQVEVIDNGRGIPIDLHKDSGINALELVMCHLHAGGKFEDKEVSAGLHGVGVAAVNAVSVGCVARVERDGKAYQQEYARGQPLGPIKELGKSKRRGTTITFLRDLEIFSGVLSYEARQVKRRLEELAFLNPGLTIRFEDAREAATAEHATYRFEGGIEEYLQKLIGKKRGLVPILRFTSANNRVDVAMTWTQNDGEIVKTYANNTFNADGGSHLAGLKNALTRIVGGFAKEHNMLRGLGEEGILGVDVREGMVAVLSLKMPGLQYSGQTKDKLVSDEAKRAVEELFNDQVRFWFSQNPGTARKIAERAVLAAKAREAAKKAREQVKRKEWMDPANLPGKLADCQSRDPDECEVFLVEGDSAGGSSKSARDRRTQAILPLRGKVLNVERVALETLLENKEIGTIITALGCGIEQNGSFDLSKLRYHKVILMADADVDGSHIRTLLLTFFYRSMPRLIWEGCIYIAQPPLYGARTQGAQNHLFFSTEEDLEAYRGGLGETERKQLRVTRYKGLGEMNADALAVTTMDPGQRRLKQVQIHDAAKAERLFDILMGEDVQQRREFIDDHALSAHLDV